MLQTREIPTLSSKDVKRFYKHCGYKYKDKCWNWKGVIDPKTGYGGFYISYNGKTMRYRAHRISYFIHNGQTFNQYVCHVCDNRKCVNPNHLYLGTQSQNITDCYSRGRRNNNKLDFAKVRYIRALFDSVDISYKEIAVLLNVSPGCIRDVITRRRWNYVP